MERRTRNLEGCGSIHWKTMGSTVRVREIPFPPLHSAGISLMVEQTRSAGVGRKANPGRSAIDRRKVAERIAAISEKQSPRSEYAPSAGGLRDVGRGVRDRQEPS